MPGAQININGIGMTFAHRQALIDNMVLIDGNTALAQDDVGMAQELRVRLGSDSQVMYRRYLDLNGDGDGDEDELYRMMSNDDWLNAVAEGGANGVLAQYHNEPVIDQNNAPAFVAKNVDLLNKAHTRGQRVGVGVFAVGNPHESLIRSGAFDAMLLACHENDELVVHEYFWNDPLAPNERGFLCFRLEEWLERIAVLRQQGKVVKLKRFRVAEYGRDQGGGQNDGWRGQGWSAEFYLSLLLKGMNEYKRLAIEYNIEIYVNIFCGGSGFGNRWQSFNVEGEQVIYDGLRLWNRNNPIMSQTIPPPTSGGVPATLTAVPSSFVNSRSQPNGSASDLGDLLIGDQVTYYPNYHPETGWVYQVPTTTVPRPAGRQPAAAGWVSLQGGAVVFTPEATDDFEIWLENLKDVNDEIFDASTRMRTLLNNPPS